MIPSYNCVAQIGVLIADLAPYVGHWNEVWFVDNGSTDGTQMEIQESIKRHFKTPVKVKILQNSENVGLGGTHKAVFKQVVESEYCSVTVLHGDNQATISDAVQALNNHRNNPDAFILGSRFSERSTLIGYKKSRIAYNRIMNAIFGIMIKKTIQDLGSGLNIFPVAGIGNVSLDQLPNDLTFNIELLKWIAIEEREIIWLPITWREEGQVSNVKMVSQTLKSLKLCLMEFGKSGDKMSPKFFQSEINING